MPDQEDFRMDHSDILDCKLALMGVWTQACRDAAAPPRVEFLALRAHSIYKNCHSHIEKPV